MVRMRSCGDNLVSFKIRVGRGKFLKIEEIFSKAFVFYDKGRDVLKGVYWVWGRILSRGFEGNSEGMGKIWCWWGKF